MTLREICGMLNVSRRVIQGYEKTGLVRMSGRNKYGHLLYEGETVDRIVFIRFCQKIGFELKQIREFIDLPAKEIGKILEGRKEVMKEEMEKQKERYELMEEMIRDPFSRELKERILRNIKED